METESSQQEEEADKPTMNPLAVTSVLANFLFATAPFTYPFGFVRCGPALSIPLLCVSCFCSYMTAEFLIEAVASVNYLKAKRRGERLREIKQQEDTIVLDESGFKEQGCVEVPSLKAYEEGIDTEEMKEEDKTVLENEMGDSAFEVGKKQELSELAKELSGDWLQSLVVFVLVPYMYGALLVKHVAGSESLV